VRVCVILYKYLLKAVMSVTSTDSNIFLNRYLDAYMKKNYDAESRDYFQKFQPYDEVNIIMYSNYLEMT